MIISHHKSSSKSSKVIKVSFFLLFTFLFSSILLLLVFKDPKIATNKIRDYLGQENNIVLRTYLKSMGVGAVDRDIDILGLTENLFLNFPSNIINQDKLPQLRFDIKFKEYEKLRINREEILINNKNSSNNDSGIIMTKNLDWSKAEITFNNKKIRAKVRLKGDLLDHVSTKKISFRVNVKNDSLEGMRKFNHQGPFTRDFHTEALIHQAMMYRDVIAPRHFFANTIINGEKMGSMYIEEHLSEPMTEYASRPYGALIRFDDFNERGLKLYDSELFWNDNKNAEYAITNLDFFLGDNFETGVTTKFLEDPKIALRNFDLPTWARYVAVTFVFRCFHGNGDSNLRFYFHPFKKKIEPISFDNSCGQKDTNRPLGYLPLETEFIYKLIENKSFREMLKKELNWWEKSSEAKEFIAKSNEAELSLRKVLSIDSPFLGKFEISMKHIPDIETWLESFDNKEVLKTNEALNQIDNLSQGRMLPQDLRQPRFSLKREDSSLKLVLENPDMGTFDDLQIIIERKTNTEKIQLDSYEYKKDNYTFIYDLSRLLSSDGLIKDIDDFTIEYMDKETGGIKRTKNIYYTYSDNFVNKLTPTSSKIIQKYFQINEINRLIILEKNQEILIKEQLILPDGYSLVINEGCVLSFDANASLIVNGGTNISGTSLNPVQFQGINKSSWPGIVILANNNNVYINRLFVEGASGKSISGFSYTGGVSIFQGKIDIQNSVFSKNTSEDALNIISSIGNIENLEIIQTQSDGLDIDFGELNISNSFFNNIGNTTGADAIDISHAKVNISNVQVFNSTDKGLSVGESAQVRIDEFKVKNALVGIAVKDSSLVNGNNIELSEITLADAMAYRKKPQFQGATVILKNLNSNQSRFINQMGSTMIIDNRTIKESKINVDSLYDSIMLSVK